MTNTPITASVPNAGLKPFIIGKLWVRSQDGQRAGSIKISRDLPTDIVLKAGNTLFLYPNKQRTDKMDADYSVQVLLPSETTDKLIETEHALVASRKEADEE